MKRKEILHKLEESGFILKEGGSHTKVYDKNGKICKCDKQAK